MFRGKYVFSLAGLRAGLEGGMGELERVVAGGTFVLSWGFWGDNDYHRQMMLMRWGLRFWVLGFFLFFPAGGMGIEMGWRGKKERKRKRKANDNE